MHQVYEQLLRLEPAGRHRHDTPRRALLVAVASGQVPPWYLREVFDWRDTDLRLALVEATHLDATGDD